MRAARRAGPRIRSLTAAPPLHLKTRQPEDPLDRVQVVGGRPLAVWEEPLRGDSRQDGEREVAGNAAEELVGLGARGNISVNIACVSAVKRRSTATTDAASSGSVRAAIHSSLQANEGRSLEHRPEQVDGGVEAVGGGVDHRQGREELRAATVEEVLDGRGQQLRLRGEVMQLRAPV